MTDAQGSEQPARPLRLRLNGAELAYAFGLAGLQPSPRADLPDLGEPARNLAGIVAAGILSPDAKQVTPAARAALEVLADPSRVTVVLANVAGEATCTESVILSRRPEGPYVMAAREPDAVDLALLPDRGAALAMIDSLLSISTLPARADTNAQELDLAGAAALAAAADVFQEAELRARLERRVDAPDPALTEEAMEEQMARGRASVDTRWACSLAQLIYPAASLTGVKGRQGAGLASLEKAGVVKGETAGHTASDAGKDLIESLTRLVGGGSVSTGAMTAAGRVATGHVSLFRAADVIVAAAWESNGPEAQVTVIRPDAAGALRLLDGLIEHAGEGAQAPQPVS